MAAPKNLGCSHRRISRFPSHPQLTQASAQPTAAAPRNRRCSSRMSEQVGLSVSFSSDRPENAATRSVGRGGRGRRRRPTQLEEGRAKSPSSCRRPTPVCCGIRHMSSLGDADTALFQDARWHAVADTCDQPCEYVLLCILHCDSVAIRVNQRPQS